VSSAVACGNDVGVVVLAAFEVVLAAAALQDVCAAGAVESIA
jgi:hypothetical protein